MDILRRKGIDWKKRRLIQSLYLNQRVRVQVREELTEERRDWKGCQTRILSLTFAVQHIPRRNYWKVYGWKKEEYVLVEEE